MRNKGLVISGILGLGLIASTSYALYKPSKTTEVWLGIESPKLDCFYIRTRSDGKDVLGYDVQRGDSFWKIKHEFNNYEEERGRKLCQGYDLIEYEDIVDVKGNPVKNIRAGERVYIVSLETICH